MEEKDKLNEDFFTLLPDELLTLHEVSRHDTGTTTTTFYFVGAEETFTDGLFQTKPDERQRVTAAGAHTTAPRIPQQQVGHLYQSTGVQSVPCFPWRLWAAWWSCHRYSRTPPNNITVQEPLTLHPSSLDHLKIHIQWTCVFDYRNVISSAKLGCPLDLNLIASKAWNVQYNPKVQERELSETVEFWCFCKQGPKLKLTVLQSLEKQATSSNHVS